MSASGNAANFNGQKPTIDPTDTAMLLIDHQSGLFQIVKDIDVPQLRANAIALAKAALENLANQLAAHGDTDAVVNVNLIDFAADSSSLWSGSLTTATLSGLISAIGNVEKVKKSVKVAEEIDGYLSKYMSNETIDKTYAGALRGAVYAAQN